MRKLRILVCCTVMLLLMQLGMAQVYRSGDKAEALVNNVWKPVQIVKVLPGKTNVYEVKLLGVQDKPGQLHASVQVTAGNLRLQKQAAVEKTITTAAAPVAEAVVVADPHLGSYEMYSGIPTMYIGHFVLLSGGKYKVALSSDETNYEYGTYKYDPATHTIEWLTGLFKNNNWKGTITSSGNNYHIQFNKVSYGDSN